MAKHLPKYPNDYDLTHSNVTRDGDLTLFYQLAAGEEGLLPCDDSDGKAKKGDGNNHDWMGGGNEKKKKKNRNQRKKKANGNNSNQSNISSSPPKPKPTFSLIETERLLHSLNNQTIVDATIRLSGYHPPPPHRRVLGDLAYMEVLLPNNSPAIHVTAFSLGFYVNKSTNNNEGGFDPTPADEPCYSHSLLDCLLRKSKWLREAWDAALAASETRAEVLKDAAGSEDAFAQLYRPAASRYWNNHGGAALGSGAPLPAPSTFVSRLDGITLRPTWLVPLPFVGNKKCETWKNHGYLHRWNVARSEEELTNLYGMDVRSGGMRDWNEELQGARDMGVDTLEERMERAR